MDLMTATVVYCFLVAGLFIILWMYYDRRDHRLFEAARRKGTFVCVRCSHIYSAPGRPDLCKCPKCGHENTRLKF